MPIEESLYGHCPLPVWTWHMKADCLAGAGAIYVTLAGLTRRLTALTGRRQTRFFFRFDVSDLLQMGASS